MYKSIWEREIEKEQKDKRNSVIWEINKSIVSDIQHSNEEINKVSKKGSEIKEKLLQEKSVIGDKIIEVKVELKRLISNIGCIPKGNVDSGVLGKLKYSYSQIYSDSEGVETVEDREPGEMMKKKSEMMRNYNSLLYQLNQYEKDLKYLNTLYNSIIDNKMYKLNVRVASELGF